MVAEAQVHRHLEAVSNDLGVVETSRILEVKVVVGRRVVMEIVANEEHLLDGGMERIDKIACRDQPWSSEQNALIVLHPILAAFDIEVVDDMGISNEREVELVR